MQIYFLEEGGWLEFKGGVGTPNHGLILVYMSQITLQRPIQENSQIFHMSDTDIHFCLHVANQIEKIFSRYFKKSQIIRHFLDFIPQ